LAPPATSSLVREQFPDLVTDADGNAVLAFDAPAMVTGRVFVGDSSSPSIAAHISAVLASDPGIPGPSLVFDTDSVSGVALGATSFDFALPPGSYNLHVAPTAPDVPPMVVPVTVSGDRLIDIVIPASLFAVDGHVYDHNGQGVPQLR